VSVTAVAEVNDVASIIAVTGFPSIRCCRRLAVADVRDLCVVFSNAVDPAVARLLLLLSSLESCCCFHPCF
jgi:hypothetical protein